LTIGGQIFPVLESGPVGLTSVSPAVVVGGTSITVTLSGSNFVSGATVSVSNPGVTVSDVVVVNANQITATLTTSPNAVPGSASVTVSTLAGTSGALTLTVNPPVPVLTSIAPSSGVTGNIVPVTLTGSFLSGASLTVSNPGVTVSDVAVAGANRITATLNIAFDAPPEPMRLTATTAGGLSTPVTFTIIRSSATPGSVVNAASNLSYVLPNAAIAQGSIFVFYGRSIGPATLVQAKYPLPTTLAGTSAQVTVNGTTAAAYMVYTSATQAAMVMPSSVPPGSGTVTISYNGQSAAPAPVVVVPGNFGIFTLNQGGSGPAVVTDVNFQAITLVHPAQPGQVLTLWGTGLGPISSGDNTPPPVGNVGEPVAVYVGSGQAQVAYQGRSSCCAGLDQINFVVPAGIAGCYVPVTVQSGNIPSNFATISISTSGDVCSDDNGFSVFQLRNLATGKNLRMSTFTLNRSTLSSLTNDTGTAQFSSYTPDQLIRSLGPSQMPSPGTCTVLPFNGYAPAATDPIQPKGLDAGTSINVVGPNGIRQVNANPQLGSYSATLGTSLNNGQPYLDPGTHTYSGFGGTDVHGFSGQVQMPPTLAWTNQNDTAVVYRSQGATVTWTGGDPKGFVYISGVSVATPQDSQSPWAGARFACTAPTGAGQFTIPALVLKALPMSGPNPVSLPAPLSYLSLTTVSELQTFVATGLDAGMASAAATTIQPVTYR
jgi:uncharacterized protein (TIGR03437 family)